MRTLKQLSPRDVLFIGGETDNVHQRTAEKKTAAKKKVARKKVAKKTPRKKSPRAAAS